MTDAQNDDQSRATGGLPPAGWYPDPAGGPARRWWDGAGWPHDLEQQQGAPEARPASTPQPASAPGPAPASAPHAPIEQQQSYGQQQSSGQYGQQSSYGQ